MFRLISEIGELLQKGSISSSPEKTRVVDLNQAFDSVIGKMRKWNGKDGFDTHESIRIQLHSGEQLIGDFHVSFPTQKENAMALLGISLEINTPQGLAKIIYPLIMEADDALMENLSSRLSSSHTTLPSGWKTARNTWFVKTKVEVPVGIRNLGIGTSLLTRGEQLLQLYFSKIKKNGFPIDSYIHEYEDDTKSTQPEFGWTGRRLRDVQASPLPGSNFSYSAHVIN